jgi:GWxTD domain-containing protein
MKRPSVTKSPAVADQQPIGYYSVMIRSNRIVASFFLILVGIVGAVTARGEDELQSALEQLAAGDTLAAIEQLERTDLKSIRDPQWFILLGALHRSRNTVVDRLKSQYVLERALQLFPNDPDVLQALGMTYFSQTFYPDAARCFRRAIEIDPDICVSKYKLGVTYYERWKLRVNAFVDDAAKARAWLKFTLECDSTNVDAAIRYVYSLYALDRVDEAVDASRHYSQVFPANPEFPLLVGTAAYDRDQSAEADSCYQVALTLMGEEELAAYTTLGRNILGYDDMGIYEDANEDERAVMDHAFWVVRDPDPTTDINERFLEHVYRTFRADLFFSHSKVHISWVKPQIRGWNTERGEISIKFGWPTDIHASYGGDRFESWTYVSPGQIHEFFFSDRFLNGNLQIPPSRSSKLAFARHEHRVTLFKPPAIPVNGAMDAMAFKDDDFQCSVYVAMQVNADSVLNNIDVSSLNEFHVRARFFDEDWVVERSAADTLRALDMAMVPGSQCRLFDVVTRHQMPFGRYNLACAFEDDGQMTLASFVGRTESDRLLGSAIITSDLVFLREGSEGSSIARRGEILPVNPWRAYAHGQPVRVYFEIYNLNVVGGRSRYRLTFGIHKDPEESPSAWNRLGRAVTGFVGIGGGDPEVTQTFERVGLEHDGRERIAIDIDSLEEGPYRLVVTVTDLHTGERTETGKNFVKVGL